MRGRGRLRRASWRFGFSRYHLFGASPDSIVEVAADPFQELLAAVVSRHEHRPMNRHQSAAAIHLLLEHRQPIADQQRMILRVAVGAVGEHDDRVGVVERGGIARPAVGVDLGLHAARRSGAVSSAVLQAAARSAHTRACRPDVRRGPDAPCRRGGRSSCGLAVSAAPRCGTSAAQHQRRRDDGHGDGRTRLESQGCVTQAGLSDGLAGDCVLLVGRITAGARACNLHRSRRDIRAPIESLASDKSRMKTATEPPSISNGQLGRRHRRAAGARRGRGHSRRAASPMPARRPAPPARPAGAARIDARGGTIMPGLVEAHFHPTYFNVADLEDLDIKYPVEYVTLLAAANAQLALECGYTAARSGGSLFNIDVWLKKAIEEDLMPGPAAGRQRPRDLRRRRADGLEPRLSQDRHGRPGAADQRPRRRPPRRAQAGQGRRRMGQDLSHRRRRRARHQRPSHAVHDVRRDARRRRRGAQSPAEGDRPLPRDGRGSRTRCGPATTRSSTARSWTTRRSTCCSSATRRSCRPCNSNMPASSAGRSSACRRA